MPIYRVSNNVYSIRVVPGRHARGAANTASWGNGTLYRPPVKPAPNPLSLSSSRFVEATGPPTQTLDGALFTKAPTFFTGAITTGPVTLTGALFTKAPTFFTGSVTTGGSPQTVNGVLFTKAPTFFAGTLISSQILTGVLFTKTPTFPVGVITKGYIGGLPAAAVIAIYDARTITGSDNDPITSWADVGPLAQTALAQSNASFKPVLDTDGWGGGIRSVVFDGSNDRLDTTLDQTYSGDFAIVTVFEYLTYLISGSSDCTYSTGSEPDKNILGVESGDWVVMSGPVGNPANHHHGGVLDLTAVPVRVVMTQLVNDSGIHRLWERSVLVINEIDSAQGSPLNNMGALKLGAREDNSRFTNMRLAYVLLVDMADTNEAGLLLARDALGLQFAVPDMDAQAVQGSLFVKAPTFFVGAVTSVRALTGTLFTKAPTFPTGAVTATSQLTGTLFTKAPTFPVGTVTPGAAALTGTLFTKAPTFFAGVLQVQGGPVLLGGTLFVNTPTFPIGTVSAGVVGLTGVLFQKAPTFPTGAISATATISGVLFTKTPTFFVGALIADQVVAGVLFAKAPTFFVGTLTVLGLTFWSPNPVGYTVNPVAYTPIGPDDPNPWP